MPQYRIVFDTDAGEQDFKLNLTEEERLSDIFEPLMDELQRKGGGRLRGEGPPQVIHKNRVLDIDKPLASQEVGEGETVRITCYYRNG